MIDCNREFEWQKTSNTENSPVSVDNPEQTAADGTGKIGKKKRNRRAKTRANQKVTNELLNNLDTDDLVDFINNCGSKKEDLKKQGSAAKITTADGTELAEKQPEMTASEPAN